MKNKKAFGVKKKSHWRGADFFQIIERNNGIE